jgi:AbrB family looped-hinge helix DNA binding protein
MESKIDSKGRVVIPQAIQDNLKLSAGDTFTVEITDTGILLTPVSANQQRHSQSVVVLRGTPKGKPRYFTIG